jgi:D,D-heptose 1,7-bisphosphate phosphatase
MSHKAVFLDRDDTLISDPGYISDPAQVQLLPHVGHSLAMLKKMGYLLVVVTNQSGVARGIVTEQTLEQIHHHLKKLLADEGVYLDAIYYCPYHPEGTVAKYTRESDLRKPQPGMLLKAAEELDIDLSQSWMIGDSYRDIAAGSRAGCRTILLDTPGKPQVREPDDPEPDRRAVNLREAVNILRMVEFQQKAQAARAELQEAAIEPKEKQTPQEQKPQPQEAVEPAQTESKPAAAKPSTAEKPKAEPLVNAAAPNPVQAESTSTPPVSAVNPDTEQKISTPSARQETPSQAALPSMPAGDVPPSGALHTDKTHQLLEEILHHFKLKHRYEQYSEFSVFMLLAWLVQVLAVFCLVVSIWFGLDRTRGGDAVQTMIGYAIALQLLVIALLLMHDRSK